MGCLLSIIRMHFCPECSNKVKRSLEFITEKRLLLWDLSGIGPRRAASSPCNCWSTESPLFSQVSQLQRLLPLPESKSSPPCKAAQQLHDRKDFFCLHLISGEVLALYALHCLHCPAQNQFTWPE